MNPVSEWTIYARRFVATGLSEFLAKAIEVCQDNAIREYLIQIKDTENGLVKPYLIYTLADQLRSRGRMHESALAQILGIKMYASVAGYPESTDDATGKYAEILCHQAAYLSREHCFKESEAFFVSTLGMRESKLRNWENARRLIERSLHLYRTLAKIEPLIYREDWAKSLGNLGNVLRSQRKFSEAENALNKGVAMYREIKKVQHETYKLTLATMLHNLANILAEQRKFLQARQMYGEALKIRQELAAVDAATHLPSVAMTLDSLGNVLCMQRKFPESCQAYEEALSIRRNLVKEGRDSYLPHVAMTLSNLGIVLREEERYQEARQYLEEALEIRRQLACRNPQTYKPVLAETLTNLGNLLYKDQKLTEAKLACQEALQIRQELVQKEPEAYRPYLADSLNNLGTVLQAEHNLSEAVRAFEQALEIRRRLAQNYPQTYLPFAAGTLNNLSYLLDEMGLRDKALRAARRAVRCAESQEIPLQSRFIAKGMAMGAYTRVLSSLVEEKDIGNVFCCLAAMREGSVRAFDEKCEYSLKEATRALEDMKEESLMEIHVIIIQQLTQGNVFFGVMKPTTIDSLIYEQTNAVTGHSEALYRHIRGVFHTASRDADVPSFQNLSELGEALWDALPVFVREAFNPNNNHKILISADPYWSAFPWEALHFGGADHNFVGLYRPLVRWGPLTHGSLRRIRKCPFGQGESSAAVISPWNVPNMPELQGAKDEAYEVVRLLSSMGYQLASPGSIAIGKEASSQRFSHILEEHPSVIHYTGHGGIVGNEEVLFLWDSISETSPSSVFGRKEISELSVILSRKGRLLSNGPLVVLNSCMSGRIRDYGGQREDLAWTFLQEGAEAVIASPMPVSDVMGKLFGTELYDGCRRFNSMADSFAHARKQVEKHFRTTDPLMWRAWTLMHYHGNPYAYCCLFC